MTKKSIKKAKNIEKVAQQPNYIGCPCCGTVIEWGIGLIGPSNCGACNADVPSRAANVLQIIQLNPTNCTGGQNNSFALCLAQKQLNTAPIKPA